MTLPEFLAEVEALRSERIVNPNSFLRMRYRRYWGGENSVIEVVAARREDSSLKVSLYPLESVASTRPLWDFFVDPLVDLDAVAQGAKCLVVGHLAPGRAVLVNVGALSFVSITPLGPPLLGKKFSRGLGA